MKNISLIFNPKPEASIAEWFRIHSKIIISILVLIILFITMQHGNNIIILFENNKPSQSIGTPSNGRLINGKRLPSSGPNFKTYSRLLNLIGRNHVHHKVRNIILDTYNNLYKKYPNKKFIYGETGLKKGGTFWPHKTHQNGLSVDFMVPVINKDQKSVFLKTNIFNLWGYKYEFDAKGIEKKYQIDFQALAAHINELQKVSQKYGIRIRYVIFDPQLQKYLSNVNAIHFSQKRSWIRHDEHYHVEFEIL
ncbi:penicillin-insensitive murein endopeptidase [Candidatus Margulisiibacteriota bacterium]